MWNHLTIDQEREYCLTVGETYNVTDKISISIPTVKNILKYGERDYYRIVYAFASTSSDYKAQLFDEGMDWQDVSDYDVFTRLFLGMRNEDLSILFGDLDVKNYRLAKDSVTGDIIFYNEEIDSVIDRNVYELISAYICAMNGVEKNWEKADDEATKRALIEESREKLLYQKDKPYEPHLKYLVCSMANTPEFKADYFGALDYPVSIFMDCVHQVQHYKHFNYTMQGVYAGTVDMKKIPKSQLNWLKRT